MFNAMKHEINMMENKHNRTFLETEGRKIDTKKDIDAFLH